MAHSRYADFYRADSWTVFAKLTKDDEMFLIKSVCSCIDSREDIPNGAIVFLSRDLSAGMSNGDVSLRNSSTWLCKSVQGNSHESFELDKS